LFDAHTDALALLDRFTPGEKNVIVDAADMGLEPGAVAAFRPAEVHLKIRSDHLSMHGFGLGETFAMAERMGTLPGDVLIVGVQPARMEINTGLSEPVAAAIPQVLSLIEAEATE
jgi:hydrogenase maturation protease